MPQAAARAAKQSPLALLDELVPLLSKHVPPFEARRDAKGGYHLWSTKPIVIDGRKKNELYFAGLIPQKGYLGFYYMPVYTDPERKALFQPELLALLKGKSCFYIRGLDRELKSQVRDALSSGRKLYRKRGWI